MVKEKKALSINEEFSEPGSSDHGSSENSENEVMSVTEEDTKLKRNLKNRHLSLLALAGIIGPGILIGASLALQNGPGSMLIAFVVIGVDAFAMMQSLGELSSMYPVGGAFSTLANKLTDRALGGTLGWFYVIIWVAVLANEYNALAAIMVYWGPQIPLYGYILIFWAFFLGFQFLGVATFGEVEFWLAIMKLVGLLAFYLFAIIYAAGGIQGHEAFGFQYWKNPGAFNDGFKGFAGTLVFASTFYSGTESVALAASESRNPTRALPIAIRQTFWRILFVYIGIAISYGLTVPSNDPLLTRGTKTLQSPMTVAITRAGWPAGANLVNAFILITCVSAVNSSIYIGSRTIVNLAIEGAAPRFMRRVNKKGVPYIAVILMNLLGLLSLMNINTGAARAYGYIVNLSGVAVFIVWGAICALHLRFRMALKKQGRSLDELPYRGALYPYLPILGLVLNTILALIQGWSYFVPFDAASWVDAYILIPFFPILALFLKLVNRTKWNKLGDIDLDTGRRQKPIVVEETEKKSKMGKLFSYI